MTPDPSPDTTPDPATTWLACEHAWLGDRIAHDVLLGIGVDGTFTHVVERSPDGATTTRDRSGPGTPPPDPDRVIPLSGTVLPGLVSAHGHAFHRLLRGRTQPQGPPTQSGSPRRAASESAPGGAADPSFWGWREQMYAATARLDPETLFTVARAAYGEMALAGITTVGEFHYLHHGPDGQPYDDRNAMGHALVAAANEVGVRLTLVDALYLTGRVGATVAAPDLDPVQRRFSDGDAVGWADRVADLAESTPAASDLVRVGVAIHSVRAVPPSSMGSAVDLVDADVVRVLHAHVAEQVDEVAATRAVHGRTPLQVLADAGVVSDRFTAVHGVWLDDEDVAVLADAGATVCACPTTERDLADGVVDGSGLAAAGVRLALGCDQHAVVDLFEEARALELDQRLVTGIRGHHGSGDLLAAATTGGAASIGWPEAGRLAVGAPADLVVVDTGSVRLAGSDDHLADTLVYGAGAADVVATMVAGRWIVQDGRHVTRDVPGDLRAAMAVAASAATGQAATGVGA